MVWITLLACLWIAPSYLVARYAADHRGHSFGMFFLLGLATSFVVPLVLALVLAPSGGVKIFVPASDEVLHAGRLDGAPAMHHDLDVLERLSNLHDRGILSDDEFVEQKNRVLAAFAR